MPLPQVRKTWPRRVQNIDDVPQAFQPYFEIYAGKEFPYVIFDPAERTFSTRVHAKVICVLDDEIRIYEKENKQVKETCVKVEDVNYVEFGTILLYSWITINLSGGNQISNLTLIFNSTAEPLYKPVIDRLRGVPAGEDTEATDQKTEEERDKFDFLMAQNFKFMSFGRKSIEPGEEIRQILFQPEVKMPYLKLFGKTYYKSILKTSLVVLTDTELIVIREPENTRINVAGVRCYFPLGRVKDMRVENLSDLKKIQKCIMEIVFKDNNHLSLELEQCRYEEVKSITDNLKMQTGVFADA